MTGKKVSKFASKVGMVAYEHPNGTYKICINQSPVIYFCAWHKGLHGVT